MLPIDYKFQKERENLIFNFYNLIFELAFLNFWYGLVRLYNPHATTMKLFVMKANEM